MTEQERLVAELLEIASRDQRWALVMAGCGALAVVASVACFLIWPTSLARGAGWPLLLLGAVFLTSGLVSVRRVSLHRTRLPELVREAPHVVGAVLVPEAEAAQLTLSMLRWVDGGLGLLGLVLLTRPGRLRGAGLGLVLTTALAFAFDVLELERTTLRRDALVQLAATSSG